MKAPSPKEFLILDAIATAEECAFPDWDGYGAEAVTKEGNYHDAGCGPESEGLPAGLVAALERLDAKV